MIPVVMEPSMKDRKSGRKLLFYFANALFFDLSADISPTTVNALVDKIHRVESETLKPIINASVFLSHTWQTDELSKNTHEQVREINTMLKSRGITSWPDEESIESPDVVEKRGRWYRKE